MLTSARNKALDLLARREYCADELRQRLKQYQFASDEIEQAIESLQRDNLQSDSRFAESYINHRINAGLGPLKIRLELRRKGVAGELIDEHLPEAVDWDDLLKQQRIKKYGHEMPADYAQQVKQARFLQNRGFSPESVMRLFR